MTRERVVPECELEISEFVFESKSVDFRYRDPTEIGAILLVPTPLSSDGFIKSHKINCGFLSRDGGSGPLLSSDLGLPKVYPSGGTDGKH